MLVGQIFWFWISRNIIEGDAFEPLVIWASYRAVYIARALHNQMATPNYGVAN